MAERTGFDFTDDQMARLWERAKINGLSSEMRWANGPAWRLEHDRMLMTMRAFRELTEREPVSDLDLHFFSQAKRHRTL